MLRDLRETVCVCSEGSALFVFLYCINSFYLHYTVNKVMKPLRFCLLMYVSLKTYLFCCYFLYLHANIIHVRSTPLDISIFPFFAIQNNIITLSTV